MDQQVLPDTMGKEHKVTFEKWNPFQARVIFLSFADLSSILEEIYATNQSSKRVKEQIVAAEIEFDRKEIPDDQKRFIEKRLQSLYSKECSMYNTALRLQERIEYFELEVSVTRALVETNNHDGTWVESKISGFENELDNEWTGKSRQTVLGARLKTLYVVRDYLCKLKPLLQAHLIKALGRLIFEHFKGLYGCNEELRVHAQPEKGFVEAMTFWTKKQESRPKRKASLRRPCDCVI
jgi:hypothetical protein